MPRSSDCRHFPSTQPTLEFVLDSTSEAPIQDLAGRPISPNETAAASADLQYSHQVQKVQ